jgi:hypothetical protein
MLGIGRRSGLSLPPGRADGLDGWGMEGCDHRAIRAVMEEHAAHSELKILNPACILADDGPDCSTRSSNHPAHRPEPGSEDRLPG